jgi:uncharacterized protein (DUF2267 family)
MPLSDKFNIAHTFSRQEKLSRQSGRLEIMVERLTSGAARDLAAQLPREIGVYLASQKPTERFEVDEFFQTRQRARKSRSPASVFHARAVVEVLGEALSPGEMADVRWPTLCAAGFTDRLLSPAEERQLLNHGCRATSLVD